MGVSDFFKKSKVPKEVEQIIKKITQQRKGSKIVDQAISYRNLGHYDKAISLLEEAIRKYPVYTSAKTVLGCTLMISGDIDGAERQFKMMLAEYANGQDYPLIEVYANLGSLYYNYRKDIETALKYYELALNAPKPKEIGVDDKGYEFIDSNVFRDLCLIYFLKQDFQIAKEYAFKRLQTIKECPIASRVYGCCLFFELLQKGFQKGIEFDKDTENTDIENVVKYLEIAIEDNPEDHAMVAYSALSLFYMRHMKFYKKNPTLTGAMEQKEKKYVEHLKKYSEMSDAAMASYKIYQDNVTSFLSTFHESYDSKLNAKGNSLYNLGRFDEAILCYNKVLEIDPRDTTAWINKGSSLLDLGRFDEAILCCNKALEIDPRDALAWINKGSSLRKLGRFDEAILCCNKALEIDPRDALAWINKGSSLLDLGRLDEAILCCNKALEIDPRATIAWDNKGTSLLKLGRLDEALTCCNKALEINPRATEAWRNKGLILANLGRFDEAILCCNKVLEIDQSKALTWYLKAIAEEQIHREQDAIHSFQQFIERAHGQYPAEVDDARQQLRELEK